MLVGWIGKERRKKGAEIRNGEEIRAMESCEQKIGITIELASTWGGVKVEFLAGNVC